MEADSHIVHTAFQYMFKVKLGMLQALSSLQIKLQGFSQKTRNTQCPSLNLP